MTVKITDLLRLLNKAIKKYEPANTTAQMLNANAGFISDNNPRRMIHANKPAMHAGTKANKKLAAISEALTGLFLAAYHTYPHNRATKVRLKLAATPSRPHLMPTRNPATQTGAETKAK